MWWWWVGCKSVLVFSFGPNQVLGLGLWLGPSRTILDQFKTVCQHRSSFLTLFPFSTFILFIDYITSFVLVEIDIMRLSWNIFTGVLQKQNNVLRKSGPNHLVISFFVISYVQQNNDSSNANSKSKKNFLYQMCWPTLQANML